MPTTQGHAQYASGTGPQLSVTTPYAELLRLTKRPDDAYDWDIFMQDQQARPLVFHGTSTAFEGGIRRHGLSHRHRPYSLRTIDRVISILRRRQLLSPGADAGLQTFTRSSVRERGFSLTFDWIHALHFAVKKRGGETTELFFQLLADVQSSGRLAELPDIEHEVVQTAVQWTSALVAGHRPLIVGVRFDPTWFHNRDVTFFRDRGYFEAYPCLPSLSRADMHIGSYRERMTLHGVELPSIRDVPPSAIATFIEPEWTSTLEALLDRVWSGHG